jgi:magnesium-transporting ATPase (P-type)
LEILEVKDKFRNCLYRAFVINVFYGISSLYALFYLVQFEEIKNWDCLVVFNPLIFLAFSSETMTGKQELKSYRVKPLNVIDFVLKCAVFIITEIGYRRLQIDGIFYGIVVLTIILLILSFVFEWIMLKSLSKARHKDIIAI